MPKQCEACERNPAEIVESCDDEKEPYHVCAPCHHRLQARSLRPLEWYNLAKRHGWYAYLLHDDFYDDDGSAGQPTEAVEDPALFPAPRLDAIAHDLELLLDYSITRWHFTGDLAAAWRAFEPQRILTTLSNRYSGTENAGIRGLILKVCASSLRESAADFVRYAWADYPVTLTLGSLAEASAACQPFQEGFARVVAVLDSLPAQQKREQMYCLGFFHSPAALDWIEQNIFPPATESWGHLAAASTFNWPRAERWLAAGRPLSHIALAALEAMTQSRPRGAHVPHLHQAPTEATMREVLAAYSARDPVPRVQNGVRYILANFEKVTKGAPEFPGRD